MSADAIPLHVLVIEDDERMRDLLCRGLRETGHAATPAPDGRAGLDLALGFAFDAIVLDIGLPFRDGFELARSLREHSRAVPILMLTARDSEEDILHGFDVGTDDYLTKPFSFRELIVRLQRLVRPAGRGVETLRLTLDRDRFAILHGGRTIHLSRSEYLLLACLLESFGVAASRERLIKAVWGDRRTVTANTLDVLVNALRGKLRASATTATIATVRGVGYRLECTRIAPASQIFFNPRRELSA